jgi:hypothetical protein
VVVTPARAWTRWRARVARRVCAAFGHRAQLRTIDLADLGVEAFWWCPRCGYRLDEVLRDARLRRLLPPFAKQGARHDR